MAALGKPVRALAWAQAVALERRDEVRRDLAAVAPGRGQVTDEPWAASAPAAGAASGDVWNTPGSFNDETPF